MALTTEELTNLLKASQLTIIRWVDGKPVRVYPNGWGMTEEKRNEIWFGKR